MLIGQEKFYKSSNLWWSISKHSILIKNIRESDILGPYCLNCYSDLWIPDEAYDVEAAEDPKWQVTLECLHCQRKHVVQDSIEVLKHFVVREYMVKVRAEIPKESLDEIPSSVKVRDEDTKYFLAAKIGEKDGKKVGLVYFGEKNKEQKKEDYSQIFIDMDGEQVRFDKSNKPPKDVVAKMRVEFPDSIHEETYTAGRRAGEVKKSSTSPKRGTRDN